MTQATINIQENETTTILQAFVDNDLQVTWWLTDDQLHHLARQAIAILSSKAEKDLLAIKDIERDLNGG